MKFPAKTTLPQQLFQLHASEPTLIEVLTTLGFTNVAVSGVETFPAGKYNFTLYAEFAAYCDQNELSHYEVGTTIYTVIFTGPEGGSGYLSSPVSQVITIPYEFGISMLAPGPHRYLSQNGLNPDGETHSKVYSNLDDPNMFLVGFENLYGAGDRDYQDLVFSMELMPSGGESVGGLEIIPSNLFSNLQLIGCAAVLLAFGIAASLARNRRKLFS